MNFFNRFFRHRTSTEMATGLDPVALSAGGEKSRRSDSSRMVQKKITPPDFHHRCLVEPLEPREMLSADGMSISLATVYLELGRESFGDMFSVCWVGGESSTRLETVTFNLGSNGYFDTTVDPPGAGNHYGAESLGYLPFTLVTDDLLGTGQVSTVTLNDFTYYFDGNPLNTTGNGASSLTIVFNNGGLSAGEKLVFRIDVDHTDPPKDDTVHFETIDVISSGGFVTAWFTSDHYIMSETRSDLGARQSEAFLYTADYTLPMSIELLSKYGVELVNGLAVTNEGNWTAAVVTDIILDAKPIVSGYVYGDVVKDCYFNADGSGRDYGIGGVTVTLQKYNESSGDYETWGITVTDTSGFYEFQGLDKGTYRVVSESHIEYRENDVVYVYTDSCARSGHQSVSGDPLTLVVTVSVGSDSTENNFGKILQGSIAGNVFEDRNDNGVFEPQSQGGCDKPIAGVTIGLYYLDVRTGEYVAYLKNGVHVTAVTDANGNYVFRDLPVYDTANGSLFMTYAVREEQPDGYDKGKNHIGTLGGKLDSPYADFIYQIEVGWNQHGREYDFGELRLGTIDGNVFEDRNNNGLFEPVWNGGPDRPIAGVTVSLYYKNATGAYVPYLVNGIHVTTITDGNGHYSFGQLPVYDHGTGNFFIEYAVYETQPTEYADGKDHIGTVDGITTGRNPQSDQLTDIKIGWGQKGVDYDFGELLLGSIAGYVFEDRNDNGIYEPNAPDKPIAGVTVGLYYLVGNTYYAVLDANGNARTAITDANGYYRFEDLDICKTYAVRELIKPSGYSDGKNHIGSVNGETRGRLATSEIRDITINWAESGIDYDFGKLKPAALSGYVFVDVNDNGIYDGNEPVIPGVTVSLYYLNSAGVYVPYLVDGSLCITVTNHLGYYEFTNLTINRTYQIRETQPEGYEDGKDHVGTIDGITVGYIERNDVISGVTIGWDQRGIHYDFGERYPTPPVPPVPPTPPYNPTPGREIPPNLAYPWLGGPVSPFGYIPSNVATAPVSVSRYGGGGAGITPPYAWHLSVLNGGYPRSIDGYTSVAGFRGLYTGSSSIAGNFTTNYPFMQVSMSRNSFTHGEWILRGADGKISERYLFGDVGMTPVVGDWNGDGLDKIGLYRDGEWYLDLNGNSKWDDDDLWARLGEGSDQPVTGDWDGDGKTDIGVFGRKWPGDALAVSIEPGLPADKNTNTFVKVSRPKNVPPDYTDSTNPVRVLRHRNAGDVRLDLIDHVFEYGQEGDKAITGDWNGDGIDKIGVYRNGTWFLDVNGNGVWDDGDVMIEGFGSTDAIPVVGDWNGTGIDKVGLFENGHWSLDTTGDHRPDSSFEFGQAGDQPVWGDFNGDGKVEFGVYRETTSK